MASKFLQSMKGAKILKELKEFDNLIKAIGECKSKAEEDRIIIAEIETLKQRLSDPKLDKSRGKEYMVRLIYCEMLGHDVTFAYIKALQFASESNIHTKKAAYLALTQFFDHNHELVLLLVNTLLSDLRNDNFVIVCTALTVATKLIGPDLITALYPTVVERLRHPKEHVRKKAVMALHRFHQLDPKHEGPLSGVDLDRHFRTMLCDKDPSVMSAALVALYQVIKEDPRPYKNLIPSFTSILKQVSEHRLPKSFDYHRFPAPFIQVRLLKILALLGAGDRVSSENMYAVLQQTLRRANSSHTIGNALIYECVRTMTTIYPNPGLLAAAAESITTFLRSTSHNLRYVGIDALAGIVKINPGAATEHQLAVVDCLEDPDDTLRLKTLELLYKMTKANNVEVIVERMMSYLRSASDEHIKRDIVRWVSELAEKYAPDPHWFIGVMSEVFELGGSHVEPQLAHNLMRLVAEQDEELHRSAVAIYLGLLDKGKALPEVLLQTICWVLGEYGALATRGGPSPLPPQAILAKLVSILEHQKPSDAVKAYILTALTKLCAQMGCPLTPEAEDFVSKASSSQSLELQQRAYELQALTTAPPDLLCTVLPPDASCEDLPDSELAAMRSLAFLDGLVQQALAGGAAPYLPEEQRLAARARAGAAANGDKGHLRFEAYEQAPPPPAAPTGTSSASYSDALFYDSRSSSTAGAPAPVAAAATAAAGPSLSLKGAQAGAGGPRKWGPAQFESSTRGAPAAPAAAAGAPVGDLLGGPSSAPPAHGSSAGGSGGANTSSRPPAGPSERDLLAASIFGGAPAGGVATSAAGSKYRPAGMGALGARGSASGSQSGTQPTTPTGRGGSHQDLPDLLGGSPLGATAMAGPSGVAVAPVAPPRSDLDLLMDLEVPAVQVPPPRVGGMGLGMGVGAAAVPGSAPGGALDLLGLGFGVGSAAAPAGATAGAASMLMMQQPGARPAAAPVVGFGGMPQQAGLMTGGSGADPLAGLSSFMPAPAPMSVYPQGNFGGMMQQGMPAASQPLAGGFAMPGLPGLPVQHMLAPMPAQQPKGPAPAKQNINDPFSDLI